MNDSPERTNRWWPASGKELVAARAGEQRMACAWEAHGAGPGRLAARARRRARRRPGSGGRGAAWRSKSGARRRGPAAGERRAQGAGEARAKPGGGQAGRHRTGARRTSRGERGEEGGAGVRRRGAGKDAGAAASSSAGRRGTRGDLWPRWIRCGCSCRQSTLVRSILDLK